MLTFAVIGIDHGHIYDHVNGLLGEGCRFAAYSDASSTPALLADFQAKFPDIPVRSEAAILADPDIDVICIAAIPRDRTAIAVKAMRAGKDVMLDKPGVTTQEHLTLAQQTVAETGRIFSICFSERLCVGSAVKAGKLIAAGKIGKVIQTVGLGPHQKQHQSAPPRPDWFWDMDAVGGIITDIASHQIDQFLFYTNSQSAEVVASQVGNFGTPEWPNFQDFGDLMLRSEQGTGYVRVDWFTPNGLGCWGDGRLIILGTEGYIELRKYIDPTGRKGGGHLILVNQEGTEYIHCEGEPLDYFRQFVADVKHRTETAMSQAHVFEVCRLSLIAQEKAQIIHESPKG